MKVNENITNDTQNRRNYDTTQPAEALICRGAEHEMSDQCSDITHWWNICLYERQRDVTGEAPTQHGNSTREYESDD